MRAVIFDLDGTLVDTVDAHALAWQRVLREAQIRVEGWKVHRLIGYGEQELAQAGAYRVYANPAERLGSIYQLGLRGE
jgi:beta-phosphoglucomutase-like phosphatase (HAD superfamily)